MTTNDQPSPPPTPPTPTSLASESSTGHDRHNADLRTRIAAAVARELVQQARDSGEYQTRDCYKVADAVIRELEADYVLVPKSHTVARMTERELFGQHLAVGDDGPFMLNISPKEEDDA